MLNILLQIKKRAKIEFKLSSKVLLHVDNLVQKLLFFILFPVLKLSFLLLLLKLYLFKFEMS